MCDRSEVISILAARAMSTRFSIFFHCPLLLHLRTSNLVHRILKTFLMNHVARITDGLEEAAIFNMRAVYILCSNVRI